jgi:Flp pilus assembly protein TadB
MAYTIEAAFIVLISIVATLIGWVALDVLHLSAMTVVLTLWVVSPLTFAWYMRSLRRRRAN